MSDLLHPKSRGRIRLRSRDPSDPPAIHPNYFSHPDDVRTLAEAARFAVRLGLSSPLDGELFSDPNPRCRHLRYMSDAYWECAARHLTHNFDHDVSTCPMGPPDDPLAVVDPEIRVYGTARLRVADASVMPENISGNTYAPCVMIGEVAADLVRREHGLGDGNGNLLSKRASVSRIILLREREKYLKKWT